MVDGKFTLFLSTNISSIWYLWLYNRRDNVNHRLFELLCVFYAYYGEKYFLYFCREDEGFKYRIDNGLFSIRNWR